MTARLRLEALEARENPTGPGLFTVGGGFGGPPRVKVFDINTGNLLGDFLAYENTFSGGVNAAVGDVNNDGFSDVIVGAGVGGGPRIRAIDGRAFQRGIIGNPVGLAPLDGRTVIPESQVFADFFAFESTQRGGAFVSAGNFVGAAFSDVVIGAGPGGGPRIRVLDGERIATLRRAYSSDQPLDTVANFFAFESTFRNGVTVSASPVVFTGSQFSDIVVTPGFGGGPRVRLLNGNQINRQGLLYTTNAPNDVFADFFAADPNSRSGLFVSSADYNLDGQADVAVGTGPGLAGQVTIYNGVNLRQAFFTGTRPGDVLNQFDVNPPRFGSGAANDVYTNGVTVGSAFVPGGIIGGTLLYGVGGQGRLGEAVVTRFQTGSGFLTRQVLYDVVFDPNFLGGVFVGN